MAVTVEYGRNNDPRLALGIPVFDLYLEENGSRYESDPSLLLAWLSKLPCFAWLDRCDAHVLTEERWDYDLDTMVLVCHALLPESERVWHVLSEDGRVPMAWEVHGTNHP